MGRVQITDPFVVSLFDEEEDEEPNARHPIAEDYLADSRDAIASLEGATAPALPDVTQASESPAPLPADLSFAQMSPEQRQQFFASVQPGASPRAQASSPSLHGRNARYLPQMDVQAPARDQMAMERRSNTNPYQPPERTRPGTSTTPPASPGGRLRAALPAPNGTLQAFSPEHGEIERLLGEVRRRRGTVRDRQGIAAGINTILDAVLGEAARARGATRRPNGAAASALHAAIERGVDPEQPIREHGLRQQIQRGAQQSARETENADPQSERNRRMRAALQQQLGQPIPETLTLADVETRGIYEAMAEHASRERAARSTAEERARLEAQRAEHRTVDREDRQAFAAGEQDERLAAQQRLAQLRRRSRGGGGGGPGRVVAGMSPEDQEQTYADLHAEGGGDSDAARRAWRMLDPRRRQTALVQALGAERTAARAEGAQAQRAEQADLRRTSEYHNRLEATGIPRGEAALSQAERLMRGASDGDVRAALAAMGSPNRIAALGGNAARIAQAVQAVANVELKNQSGAAVSDQEFARFQAAAGQGSLSADALRAGMASLRRLLNAQRANLDAGYRDVVETEQRRASGPRRFRWRGRIITQRDPNAPVPEGAEPIP